MEERWSAGDDRPYVRRESSQAAWWILAAALVLAGAGAAFYFWWQAREVPAAPPLVASAPPSAPAAAKEEPAVPENPQAAPSPSLPTLDNSDAMMREALTGLVGRPAFEAMVYPSHLVRRIVATVDNLPRETAPRRVMPLEPVPGRFATSGAGEELAIGAANSARYAPYIRVFESLDTRTLVQRYVDSYPLFQRAYAELGYPDRSFNRRLVEAIDDLLAAPELAAPAKLVQPKVYYEFADPALEARSAGQKVMVRMGAENAAKVKAKLREIRRELARR